MNSDIQSLQSQLNRIEANLISQKDVLTFEETCIFMGMTASCLYKLTSSRKIPHYKPNGKMIYFDREELKAWLLQNRVSTHDELNTKALSYTLSNKHTGSKRSN